jgi:hypothetical protein
VRTLARVSSSPTAPAAAPARERAIDARLTPASLLGTAGLVLLVVGTFLPWLQSGRTLRNSYQASGTLRRLLAPDGVVGTLLSAWPFVSLACAVAIACYALGLRRTAWLLGLLAAAVGAAAAIAALSLSGSHFARPAPTGPVVTLLGSALTLGAAIIRLGTFVRDSRDVWSQL